MKIFVMDNMTFCLFRRRRNVCPFFVEDRLKLVGGWRSAGRMEGVRNVLVSELNNSVKERSYQESLHGKYEVWRGGEQRIFTV